MKKYTIIFSFVIVLMGTISFTLAHAFFTSGAVNTHNTFSAAIQFPTTPTPTPSQIAQTLVINEILPVSSCNASGTNGQFLELWNGSGSTVDLKNFSLSDGTSTIAIANSQTSLANGAFAVLVKSNGVINTCLGNVHSAVTVNLGGTVNLNTGLLKLLDAGNVVIDRVEFGASNSGVLQTNPDQSIERKLQGFDTALGDTFHASDFLVQCPPTPGTWSAPIGTCGVVINEIMWMGSAEHTASDEWIELRNMTGSPINLSNWTVDGLGSGTPGTITIPSGTIPANGFFLISNLASSSSVLNVIPDFVTSGVSLLDAGEVLTLHSSSGSIMDVANRAGAWFAGANPTGAAKKSMERNNPPSNGTQAANWHTATTSINLDITATDSATPKAAND